MTRARELYREGKLTEAIQTLQSYLRDRPSDASARIFLFELLCFAGEFVRAARQLNALGGGEGDYGNLIRLYGSALEAEQTRQDAALTELSPEDLSPVSCRVDGHAFSRLTDADERLGPRLEFIGAAEFHRIPFRYLSRIEIAAPANLRDLYFLPAKVETGPELDGFSFEQVFLPCLYAGSFLCDDELLKLGRTTEWFSQEDGSVRLAGLRLLVADGEEIALTDIRTIDFGRDAAEASGENE